MTNQNSNLSPFDNLKTLIQEDHEYAWGWHCNIAMASIDEGVSPAIGNRAAARFMQMCFGVDTSKFEEYLGTHEPETNHIDANIDGPTEHSVVSSFSDDLGKFNKMYRMQVATEPTLDMGVPLVKRLTDLKSILQKELDEIDSIIEKAIIYESGDVFAPFSGENSGVIAISSLDYKTKDNYDLDRFDNKVEILTDISDLMVDLQVYCGSELKKFGLPMDAIQEIVMKSNFSKMGADGLPIYDTQGKLQKGPKYWKPEPKIRNLILSLLADVSTISVV